MAKQDILFIGLGNMGYPMALNLLKKDFKVYGFDLVDTHKSDFEKAGGEWCSSLKSVAHQIHTVIAMLPGSPEMKNLYLTEQKLFDLLHKDTLIIDCSTADPESCLTLYTEAQKRNLRLLCAPVSGGTVGAQEGQLTFMVGGDEADAKAAQVFFSIMGKKVFYAGGISDGQSVKICNNMLLAIHMIGTSEAFALGESLGLDPTKLNDILKSSSGNNWSLEHYHPYPHLMDQVPSSRNYEGGFAVKLMLKDLSLALECMIKAKQKSELGTQAYQMYKEHFEKGFGNKDFSHIFQGIKQT